MPSPSHLSLTHACLSAGIPHFQSPAPHLMMPSASSSLHSTVFSVLFQHHHLEHQAVPFTAAQPLLPSVMNFSVYVSSLGSVHPSVQGRPPPALGSILLPKAVHLHCAWVLSNMAVPPTSYMCRHFHSIGPGF